MRKRLVQQQLTDFIVFKRMDEDLTSGSSIMRLILLSNCLFDVRAKRLAWSMLRKAEKLALANEQFRILNTVYNLQIAFAGNEFADNLEEIITKRNENKLLVDEEEQANIANSLILKCLQATNQQKGGLNFDGSMSRWLNAGTMRCCWN